MTNDDVIEQSDIDEPEAIAQTLRDRFISMRRSTLPRRVIVAGDYGTTVDAQDLLHDLTRVDGSALRVGFS